MTAFARSSLRAGVPASRTTLADAHFGIPVLGRAYVPRRRLVDALSATGAVPLVLVSGPAGSGKSSLVAEWLRLSADPATGWVTFEDGDPAFWPHVLGCLRRLGLPVPMVRGDESDDLLVGRQNVLAVAAALVDSGTTWTLVLDGYELASLSLAHEVDLLIQHTGGHLRLVLVGRVDPVLPLYRYRLKGEVAEVRCADLAFTDVEAARLLTRLGVTLSADSVHQLDEAVKGWAAGLVFAARALATAPSPENAVATVLTQASDINEYLVGEVLDIQDPQLREFLLAASVVDVVEPGLVDELLGPEAGHQLSEAARRNLFIEPAPQQAGSYRYYPFFRELLRARLAYEAPARLRELHRRAARWYRHEGAVELSVQHLVRAAAWQDLCEQLVDDGLIARLLLEGTSGALRSAVARLPEGASTAEACLVKAALALSAGDRGACATELSRARSRAADDEKGRAWAVAVNLVDAVRACATAESASADRLTDTVERWLLNGEASADLGRRLPGELNALQDMARGVALLRCGRFEEACERLTHAASADAVVGYPQFRARCCSYLGAAHAMQGELSAAERASAQALIAAAEGGPNARGAVETAQAALALVAVERYDAATAQQHLAYVTTLPVPATDRVHTGVSVIARAGLAWMHGQAEEAGAALLGTAEGLPVPEVWLSDVLRAAAARVAVAGGDAGLVPEILGDLSPNATIVAAAAQVELGEDSLASELVASVAERELPIHARVSKILVEALVASRSTSAMRARALLDDALRLAAPEGLRRPFRQVGPMLEQFLKDNADLLLEHAWLTDPTAEPPEASAPREAVSVQTRLREPQPVLIEPLTPRELEVLGHLEHLLTTEEIASVMFVSVNTVRTHVRSVLRKLGVNRRNAAVRRARELGMIRASA